jgi:hypothetical protein
MTTVQNAKNVRTTCCNLRNQQREFLISEVPATLIAAIIANERLVEAIWLKVPKLRRGILLRTMAAVIEEDDVAVTSSAKMLAETTNYFYTGSLAVSQNLEVKSDFTVFIKCAEQSGHGLNVVYTATQRRNRRWIFIDPNHRCVQGTSHKFTSSR